MAEKFVTLDGLALAVNHLKNGGGGTIGGFKSLSLTVTADELAEQPVTKPVAGLGSLNLVVPIPDDDNIAAWNESTITVKDHDDDTSIPAGSLRFTCVAEPSEDIKVRVIVLA